MTADRPGAGIEEPPDLVVLRLPGVGRPHTRLTVAGDLDMAGVPALRRAVDELVHDGCTHVDADLAAVPFCDVSGFSALLAARDQLRAEGGELTLRNPCWSLLWLRSLLRPGLTFST